MFLHQPIRGDNPLSAPPAKFDGTCFVLGIFVAMLPVAAVAIAWGVVS
jgi:hypothetical protein